MKRFPIGVDDYKKLREGNYLSVDKTLLIQEWWQEGAEVTILTRPRRFGKTIKWVGVSSRRHPPLSQKGQFPLFTSVQLSSTGRLHSDCP